MLCGTIDPLKEAENKRMPLHKIEADNKGMPLHKREADNKRMSLHKRLFFIKFNFEP